MKKISTLLLGMLLSVCALSQPYTETFEAITDGGSSSKPTTFTTGGQGFTCFTSSCSTGGTFGVFIPNDGWTDCAGTHTNDNISTYGVGTSCTSGSCSGTSAKFLDANASGTNQTYSIKTSDAALFTVKALHLYISTDHSITPGGGSVTFRGKRGGVTKFTVTKTSGFVSSFGTNNGFTYINFATEGGTDNTLTNIDELEIQGGSGANYIAVDNFNFSTKYGPLPTTSAATSVTGSGATLNGTINDNGISTTPIVFEYSTSSTLSTGVTSVTATPSSLSANAGSTSVSASISGLSSGITYYFRVKGTNAGGTNTGSILNFTTSTGTTLSLGDIAFTGYNSEPAANSDEFSFIILKPGGITSGTSIYFTDMGWKGGSCGGDNFCSTADNALFPESGSFFTWTSGSSLAYGAQVKIVGSGSAGSFTCSNGSASGAVLNLSTGGDQIFAIQGGAGGTMLAAIQANKATATGCSFSLTNWDDCSSAPTVDVCQSASNSNKPSCLITGTNCLVMLTSDGSEVDNGRLNPSLACLTGNPATDRATINNYLNWETDDAGLLALPPTLSYCAPSATTSSATSVTGTGATLNGSVNANSNTTSVTFVYGTSSSLASGNTTVSATPSSISASTVTTSVSKAITGLSGSTTYYFRVSATNSQGTTVGSILNFTTSAASTPTVTVSSQTNVACNGGSTGSATVSVSGGTPSYTYSWAPIGGSGATGTGLSAGTYTCTVTDAVSGTATVSVTITQPTALSLTAASQANVSCNGGTNGAASVNAATGGVGGYTYNWTPGTPTGDGTVSVTGLSPGTWTCTVMDANSCTATRNFNITQPSALALTAASQANVSCNGGANGAASVNAATGGAGGYTYNWTPGSPSGDGTVSVTGLTAGTWTCTVTDANSCTAQRTFTITQPTAISLTAASQVNVACNGGTTGAASVNAATGGAGGYTYNWTPGSPSGDGTVSVTGLTAGTWTCTVTDANSCTAQRTFTITQPTAISLTAASQANVSCNGGANGAASVNAATGGAGGYTYNWTPGSPSGDGTVSVTGLTAGTWTCTVTDANSCTAQRTFTITQPTAINGSTTITNVVCNGGSTGAINLTPSGGAPGYTFLWNGGATTEDRTGLAAGSYTVVITDANSCTKTVTATVTQPSSAVGGSTVATNVACFGGSNGAINLTPSGGTGPYTFNWNGGATTEDRTGLAAGSYTVVITDANSCTGTVTATVTQPTAVGGSTAVTNVTCNGGANGAINLTPSGGTPGYTFNWGGAITTEDRTGLAAGTYVVVITDANSCRDTIAVTVTQPTAVSGTRIITNVACNGGSNGAINLTPSGGTPGYTFNWGGGVTTEDRTGLTAGAYTVVITDANSCTGTVTATVTQPSSAVGGSTVVTNVACFGGSNGAINLTPSGGVGGYTFVWTGGATTEDRTGLAAGSYTVVITDANGCTGTVTATVTQPSSGPGGSTVVTNVACFGASTGAINLTPSGGTGPYTFNWGGGVTTEDRTSLAAGSYSAVVTDANSCSGTVTATVTQPAAVGGSTAVTNVACNGGSSGAINLTPSGGTGPYTFNWGGGVTTEDRTGLAAGSYSVVVTDANSCTGTVTATVTQPTAVGGSTVVTNVACNGGSNGAINLTPSGGTPGYTFNWGGGVTTEDRTGLTAGTYTVVITDANSCTHTVTATVTQPSSTVGGSTVVTNVACNGGNNGAINLTANGGTPGYTFNWGGGVTTEDRTGLTAGTYTVVITDANSCTGTVTATVTQPSAALTGSVSVTNVSCNGGSNGTINLTVSGGTPSYTFNWGGGVTTEDRTGLAAGSYSVVVTDANSCTGTVTATVTQPTAVGGSTVVTNVACNGGSSGAINLTPSGGTGPYTFNWGGGVTTEDRTGLAAGSYSVVVTDANSCTGTVTATVTQPTAISPNIFVVSNVACFGGSTGSIATGASGGTAPLTYGWSEGSTTSSISGVPVGTYTVWVTDQNGCVATASATVTQPTALVANAFVVSNVACNGGSDGSASVGVTGGTTPFTYTWSNGATTQTVSGVSSGTYTCYVTDQNGCTTASTATVTQPTALTASVTSQTNVACNGGSTGSATVAGSGGTPGYTYTWSNGATTAAVSGLFAGLFTCTVTDTHGCSAITTATITQPSAVAASISSVTNVLCFGASTGAATATASGGVGGYTYAWSGGGTSATKSGLSAGSYTCTVTDANSCSATAVATITQPASGLTISSITGGGSYCVGNTINLSVTGTGGTGSLTYSWSGPSFSSSSQSPTLSSVTTAQTGVYTATVTDANGCSATGTVSITVNTNPGASTGVTFECVGGSILLSNATSGGTWSSSNTAIATVGSSTGVVTGVATGSVNITYTLGTGCFSVKAIDVNPPMASITGTTNVCIGTTTDLDHSFTGGTWSTAVPYYATIDATTGVATGVHVGGTPVTYTVNEGCVATASLYIPNIILNITGSLAACEGATTSYSVPGYPGGTWTTSDTAVAYINGVTGLMQSVSAGTVDVTYTYAYCFKAVTATINEVPAAITGGSVVCEGGTLSLSSSTGGGVWSSLNASRATVDGSGTVTAVSPGAVTIMYTLGSGCATSKTITVGAIPAAISGTTTLCEGAITTLTCTTGGGTWSSSASGTVNVVSSTGTSVVISGVSAGVATITFHHSGACVQTVNVLVTAPPAAITGSLEVGVGGTGTLTCTTGGGTWSSSMPSKASINSVTGVVTGVNSGTTTITYATGSTCYTTAVLTVNAPPAIEGPSGVCIGATATMTFSISGGTWMSSNTSVATIDATTGVVTGVAAGLINLTYTISAGYFSVRSLYVYNNPPAISGASEACSGTTLTLTSISGGAATWTSSDTVVATVNSSGGVSALSAGVTTITYTTTATGCYVVKTITVNETPAAISGSSTICVGATETYTSSPSGGTWTSSSTARATIGGSTGITTALTPGGTTIRYTMSTGCQATKAVTVAALPGGISGANIVCVGNSVVLTAATTGSTWSTSVSGTASITATTTTVATATVAGIAAGSADISYTNSTGCARVYTVTVNAALPGIEGEDMVCVGGVISLTNSASGGTWSTISPYRVSINTYTGVVTGSSVGTTRVSYKVGAGCYTSKQLTVNAALPNIIGATYTCSGDAGAVTFTNGVSGGTWSSSNTSVAIVGSSSGVVTGVLMGGTNTNVVITYATSPGCTKTKTILIKPQPIITGSDEVSVGSTTAMTGSPSGGAWSSSAATIASISGYGVVTGVAGGSATISYTYSGCVNTKGITVTGGEASRPAGMTEEAVVLFSVFPNPSHGTLSVSTGVPGTFAIYTVDGKLASTSELTAGVNAITIPAGLAAGTYMCRFNGVDGSIQAVRLAYEP